MKLLNPHAERCAPYSDGPWCFVYDPAHVDRLRELGAYDVLLGFASGAEAAGRLEEIAAAGLVLACELGHDLVVADVLVGKRLTAAQRKKAQWTDAQGGYLRISSGRIRIETLNSLSFGPEEPTHEGCELKAPTGDYDAVAHRLALELMALESRDERPELPTVLIELNPVGKTGPKARAARMSLAEAQGELGAWLVGGRVEDGVFHGSTRSQEAVGASKLHVNLRDTHAEAMDLRFGRSLELSSGDARAAASFIGYLNRRGLRAFFGHEWHRQHFAPGTPTGAIIPFQGSAPWVLEIQGAELPSDAPVTVTAGEPWWEAPDPYRGAWTVEKGAVTGRVVWATPCTLTLNFGWDELRQAGAGFEDVLELVSEGSVRKIYPEGARTLVAQAREELRAARGDADARTSPEGSSEGLPLLASTMPFWDEAEARLLWLMPLTVDPRQLVSVPGAPHDVKVAAGDEVMVRLPHGR